MQAQRPLFLSVSLLLASAIAGLGLVATGVAPLGAAAETPDASPEVQAAHKHAKQGQDFYYTCGMHPQVVQEEPGSCPICGMNLEKKARNSRSANTSGASAGVPATDHKKGPKKILYWVAPMDPSYRADEPGKSPMGMDLVPVYEDDGSSSGLVKVDPIVVQNMGVRIAVAKRGKLIRSIRTVGEVSPAEDRLSVVNLRFSGWIEKIYADETGVFIKKGTQLFNVYSPELVSAQDELVVAMRTGGPSSPLARSAKRRLELFGVHGWQIKKLISGGQSNPNLTITAPQDGYILHKQVVEGAHVKAGMDLYRIADLSKVWVEAEVYEADAPFVTLNQKVRIDLTFQPGEPREATVSYIYPTLDPHTRTLRVRIEMDNPGLQLKPGSFVTASIATESAQEVTLIPTEALIHSGTRTLVFVAQSLGRYEAREVVSGRSGDHYVTEILSGLQPGERIVTSGQFLLDSESQLQEAVEKMLEARLHSKSPVAKIKTLDTQTTESSPADSTMKKGGAMGMEMKTDLKPNTSKNGSSPIIAPSLNAHRPQAPREPEAMSKGYWTCGMHPQIVEEEEGSCPICGMNLVHKDR